MNKIKKIFIVSVIASAFVVGIFTTKAYESLMGQNFSLIYASDSLGLIKKDTLSVGLLSISHNIQNADTDSFLKHKKKIYLSPDRKLIAVTTEPEYEGSVLTYIMDLDGNQIVAAKFGSFVSWSYDSSKVLLYLSGNDNIDGKRHIYYLGTNGDYIDSGLPAGTISADVSSGGDIVYALAQDGVDYSSVYIRDHQGKDKLILSGGTDIIVWVRWSLDRKKIAFLRADWGLSTALRSIQVMNSDGTEEENISGAEWNYPPVWSPDGSKIVYGYSGNIWEYDTVQKNNNKLTNFDHGSSRQPSYSAHGNEIVFSSDVSGSKQIWIIKDGESVQLTDDNLDKAYPMLP